MKIKQTAGRKALGEFAPKFAELNDDLLFGEVGRPTAYPRKFVRCSRLPRLWQRGL